MNGAFTGCRVTVMGLGLFGGGAATARWLAEGGARVTVTDLRSASELGPGVDALAGLDLRLVLGEHRDEDFEGAELVVANPAVPPASPFLERARRAGVRVTSELELVLDRCPARVALVTGTQGKSSTAQALAQLLERGGVRAHLGGNIGVSLLGALGAMRADDVAVLEVSSYQLEALPVPLPWLAGEAAPPFLDGRRPRVAVVCVTNVLADHLERHGTRAAYLAAKARVLELAGPGAAACLPAELRDAPGFAARPDLERVSCGALGTAGVRACVRGERFELDGEPLGRVRDLLLPGAFQRANALMALVAARRLGVPAAHLAAALPALRGLPHRFEHLGTWRGVRVVDNGVSTTPDSTVAALDAAGEPCTLLCGGRAKRGLELDELALRLAQSGSRAVCFGADRAQLAGAFAAHGVALREEVDLERAVALALEWTPRGGLVLFSPACASFDAFPNFRARALAFRAVLDAAPQDAPGRDGRPAQGARP